MRNWVIDLDGVMWRGKRTIPGSVEAIGDLLDSGDRVIFCTNNSAESGASREKALADRGVADGCSVVTSADAVATQVQPQERVLYLGGTGLGEAIADRGCVAVSVADLASQASDSTAGQTLAEGFDAVIIGLTRQFNYQVLDIAAAAARSGARLLASNTDSSFPGADGIHPGCGALVSAVETASGATAVSAGKPHQPMVDLILGQVDSNSEATSASPTDSIVIGDRPETDGALAQSLGWSFGLVLSGVTTRDDLPVEVPLAYLGENLAEIVDQID